MGRLPIFTTNENISVNPGIRPSADPVGEALMHAGEKMGQIVEQWQQTQNAAETLDGKNKMMAKMTDILDEADKYNEYQSPQQLQQKQKELEERMNGVLSSVTSGFTNQRNAENFSATQQISVMQNNEKLKAIFREKYIDLDAAGRAISEERNRQAFITTGNAAYKQSYLADLQNSLKAGYIDKKQYAKARESVNGWDKYNLYYDAENDPAGTLEALKAGKYKIKPEEYHDVLKTVASIKSNDELMRIYEENVRQDTGESDAMEYIYSEASYTDKLQYINDNEMKGNISGGFAQKARRAIKQFKPETRKTMSQSEDIADILQRAYDLNEGSFDSSEYLNGIRNLRDSIVEAVNNGDITYKDGIALNNQLNQATRKRVSQETNSISYQFGKANDLFKEQLPSEYQNDAVRELFYQTQDIDDNLPEKDKEKIYQQRALSVIDKIKNDNRLKAQDVLINATKEPVEIKIPDMAAKLNLNEEDFRRKIKHTAEKYGMTEQQALAEISKRMTNQ